LLLPLLALAACEGKEEQPASSARQPVPADLDVAPTVASAAELETKARTAVSAAVLDPGSAVYQNLRPGSAGSVCGEVNSKSENGKPQGFRPFVVSPEGVAVVSSAAGIMWDEPADLYPDFYIRYCAPPQELPALARKMAERTAAAQPPEEPEVMPKLPDDIPLPPVPAPEPPPAVEAAPPAPRLKARPSAPTSGNEDSFFNAVMRPAESDGKAK
jgi:hypothetical protein